MVPSSAAGTTQMPSRSPFLLRTLGQLRLETWFGRGYRVCPKTRDAPSTFWNFRTRTSPAHPVSDDAYLNLDEFVFKNSRKKLYVFKLCMYVCKYIYIYVYLYVNMQIFFHVHIILSIDRFIPYR